MGRAYAPIGFYAREVFWNWPNEVGRGSSQAYPGDLEYMLGELGSEFLFVDLDRATSDDSIFEPERTYPAGWVDIIPRNHYRALLYMESSPEMIPAF